MAKDQKVTLEFTLTDGSKQNVSFVVPAGKDGSNGLTRTTEIIRFDLNTPDTPSANNACGKFSSGVYFKMRDYIDGATDTNVVVSYSMLDIPTRGNLPALHSLEVSPPAKEAGTGKIFCDIQLTCYYNANYVRAVGSSEYRVIRRPKGGTSGLSYPTTTDPNEYNVLRMYKSVVM